MATLVVLVGLPGSGKSHTLPELSRQYGTDRVFDSYQKNAVGDCAHFPFSRHYAEVLERLRGGKNVVIADVRFCTRVYRQQAEKCIVVHAPGTTIEWICFDNTPEQCKRNVKHSGRGVESRTNRIDEFHQHYTYPERATRIPVWDGKDPTTSSPVCHGLDTEDA